MTWVLTCRQLKACGAFAACWGGGWEREWMLPSPWKKCPGGRVKTAFSFRAEDWSILEACRQIWGGAPRPAKGGGLGLSQSPGAWRAAPSLLLNPRWKKVT